MPLAALLPYIIPAVASVGGALITSGAARGAANTQTQAAQQAAQAQLQASQQAQQQQLQMYNQTRSDLAPYMSAGTGALSQLAGLFGIGTGGPTQGTATSALGALTNYPGYQFGLNQGLQAIDRSAASRGLALSGAQIKAADQFGTNYAQQQAWQPYLSQLGQFATMGQQSASGLGTLGFNTGAGIAGSLRYGGDASATGLLNAGQATAAGQVGSANALNSGVQSALLAYKLSQGGQGGMSPLGGGYDASGGSAGDGSALGDVLSMFQ